jgi:hypothetical protein
VPKIPSCPACYLHRVICVTCGKDKPNGPSGEWDASWWYCSAECLKSQRAQGRLCKKHREALDRLRVFHP